MTLVNLESVFRSLAVTLVAGAGLLASTPNLHGTAETRGGAACNVNTSSTQNCGDTGYSGSCLYTYTTYSSTTGWMYLTAVLKSQSNCDISPLVCMPNDDYNPSYSCTPTYNGGSSPSTVQ